MLDVAGQVNVLKKFNKKAQKLLDSSFGKAVKNQQPGFKITSELQEDGAYHTHAVITGTPLSNEAVDAFVLTFRFFIQDSSGISIRVIKRLYDDININERFKVQIESARKAINEMLDDPNSAHLSYEDICPTNRQVLNTIIYGDLAHAESEQWVRPFEEWTSFSLANPLLYSCFISILKFFLEIIAYIMQVNEEAIEELLTSQK